MVFLIHTELRCTVNHTSDLHIACVLLSNRLIYTLLLWCVDTTPNVQYSACNVPHCTVHHSHLFACLPSSKKFAYVISSVFINTSLQSVCDFPVLTLYFLVVVNNFYSDMLDKIPLGFYVDNPYFFFKSEGHKRFLE